MPLGGVWLGRSGRRGATRGRAVREEPGEARAAGRHPGLGDQVDGGRVEALVAEELLDGEHRGAGAAEVRGDRTRSACVVAQSPARPAIRCTTSETRRKGPPWSWRRSCPWSRPRPEVGRFLSRDPVWDGNVGGWYTFVGNGPVSGRDPFGDQGAGGPNNPIDRLRALAGRIERRIWI